MLSKNDAAVVYETLLTSPGMNDDVKISIRIPRKNVLILSKILELGLSAKNGTDSDSFFTVVNGSTIEEIKTISADLLAKAGLTDTYNRLNNLQSK
jgi:hypothetical protein